MGQRLVMNIYEDDGDEPIVNVYFHWSAYSRAAYYEASRFIDALYNIERTGSTTLNVIQALESFGARVLEDDRELVIKDFDYKPREDNIDRNEGLIAYSKDLKDNNMIYAEGEMDIFLNNETINNLCFWITDDLEDEEEIEEIYIPWIDYNLENITFDTLEQTLSTLDNMITDHVYVYKNEYGDYVHLIE